MTTPTTTKAQPQTAMNHPILASVPGSILSPCVGPVVDPDGVLARERELSRWYYTGRQHRAMGNYPPYEHDDDGCRRSYMLGYTAIDREAR